MNKIPETDSRNNDDLCGESALSPSFSENSFSTTNTIEKYKGLKMKKESKETTPSNTDDGNFYCKFYYNYTYFRRKTVCLHS